MIHSCFFGTTDSIKIVLEVTNHCNLSCIHCHSKPVDNGRLHNLTPEFVKSLTNEILSVKKTKAILTGGEPYMNPRIDEILHVLHNNDIRFDMCTNGTLIDEMAADRLADFGIDEVSISVDGDSESHSIIRAKTWAYDRAIQAIEMLVARAIPVEIICTINDITLSKIPKLLNVARDIGVDKVLLEGTIPVAKFMNRFNKVWNVTKQFQQWKEIFPNIMIYRAIFEQPVEGITECFGGKRIFSVSADGILLTCTLLSNTRLKAEFGVPLLVNAPPNPMALVQSRWIHIVEKRRQCGGGCPMAGFFSFGDLLKPDPLCSIYVLNYKGEIYEETLSQKPSKDGR